MVLKALLEEYLLLLYRGERRRILFCIAEKTSVFPQFSNSYKARLP